MRARRLGRVFGAEDGPSWMVSHAAYPTPVLLDKDRVRVFLVCRDDTGRGAVGWVDLDPKEPRRVLGCSDRPALLPGPRGSFDDRGISIGCVLRRDGRLWLYYMGWSLAVDVPFRNSIGLAVSTDATGTTFERAFEGPLLSRSRHDPFTLSYPFVMRSDAGWSMIYGSNRGPGTADDDMQHTLMKARSDDGIEWRPRGNALLPLGQGEFGHSRPWLLEWAGRRHLLFSVRRAFYHLAVAKEGPAETWVRLEESLFDAALPGEWDCEAQCYGAHVRLSECDYLVYNGNGYGRTGFGLAVLEE